MGLFPIQFVQTPTQVIILDEYLSEFRVIPITTTHPGDLSPSFIGDSVGRWDGNTFVVDQCSAEPTAAQQALAADGAKVDLRSPFVEPGSTSILARI